ncbi:MAG: nucleotidyltransferase domain-containing protein [Planctomycetes bacterium]|nr:nucleotidyltransferase domain-containing protein [Planctomycetota bacterium]
MRVEELHIDSDRLAELCEEYGVACLEIFGSFVRGDAAPGSDLDLLVTFEPGAKVGLGIVSLQQALETLSGRSVDLLTRRSVERSPNKYFRRFALRRTEPLYERA